jgi:hypothetical protein
VWHFSFKGALIFVERNQTKFGVKARGDRDFVARQKASDGASVWSPPPSPPSSRAIAIYWRYNSGENFFLAKRKLGKNISTDLE